jgi:hypothetical protein
MTNISLATEITLVIPTTADSIFLRKLLNSIRLYFSGYTVQTLIVCNPINLSLNELESEYIDLNLTVFQLASIGVNKARSLGLDKAIYEYVFFLDDDCFFSEADQINTLYNSITNNEDAFAVGGYYRTQQEKINFIAEAYFLNQIHWLKLGLIDQNLNKSAYLIGGYFIVRKSLCLKHEIKFDEQMKFGGTEKEFFLQAHFKNLQMYLLPVAINHVYTDTYFSYFVKIFKQGRGHRYIESKGLFFKAKYLDLNTSKKYIFSLFDVVFWSGYFLYKHELKKLLYFYICSIASAFNERKIVLLNKIKKKL